MSGCNETLQNQRTYRDKMHPRLEARVPLAPFVPKLRLLRLRQRNHHIFTEWQPTRNETKVQGKQLKSSSRPRTGARWKLQTPRDNFTVEQGFATSLLFKW